jgi:hypothetical protein
VKKILLMMLLGVTVSAGFALAEPAPRATASVTARAGRRHHKAKHRRKHKRRRRSRR